MQMSAKMNSATFQNINSETNNNLNLSEGSNTATNLKQSNLIINNNNNLSRENLLLSNCDSKLSAFTNRFRNTNKDYNNSQVKTNFDNHNYNYNKNYNNYKENYSDSLQNSENGNMKIIKSQLPYDLNDVYNKKFNLENFFNEVYYEKELESLFIIYIKDKIVSSIDYSKIFIINNKNFFILQIPFDNGKSQIFRVDYGSEITMQNYTIEITEDILKIIISLESNFGEDKKTLKIKKLNRLIMFKKFFNHFKKITSNKIINNSANAYNNNKLKRKIFNLLNLYFLITIKENVNLLKIRKFVLRKNNFLNKVNSSKNIKNERKIIEQFKLVRLYFNLFRFKAKKLHETILSKNYRISMNTFQIKKFHEKKIKEMVFSLLKKEVHKKNLYKNNSKMACYLSIFLTKKKYFGKIRRNFVLANEKHKFAFDVYRKNIKIKFFKKLLHNRHYMKRFYYLSNKYNYFNYLFLFFVIQSFIKRFSSNKSKADNNENQNNKNSKGVKIENNSAEKDINFNLIIKRNQCSNINNSNFNNLNNSFSTINVNNKDGDSFLGELNHNNSNSITDLNKSEIELSKNIQNNNAKTKGFYLNCDFKISINFKNYIYANYYNNNFHLPLVKNIFLILKNNMRRSRELRFKLSELIVTKKLKLNKELNFLRIKMTKLRLIEHIRTQRKIFWNKFKIKLNQKKLQKILKEKRQEKIFKFALLNNFISFISQINKRTNTKKYFECKEKFIASKFLKFKFFQFLSLLYMKRKIEKKNISSLYQLNSSKNNPTHINTLTNNKQNQIKIANNQIADLKLQTPLLQSSSEKFEHQFISRLISPTNFIKDLKERFFYFKRLLNLRLNYYKLIINCKREKILKRKTQKFRDFCLRIYSKFYRKIKMLLLDKRQAAFRKQKQINSFFSKIFDKIKSEKRNDFITLNLINNSKKLSFTILKEYYLYKKSKARKDQLLKTKLDALFYKYNYESFFLKNAETLKMQKYFAKKIKKNQIKNVFKTLKKISILKKITEIGKRYVIKKHLQNSVKLIKSRKREENLLRLFNIRVKKYFFRYFLRNIKKIKIIRKIHKRKNEALKIFKKNSARFLLNNIFATKANKNLTCKNKETLLKKLFILKLKKLSSQIATRKVILKKYVKKLFLKKTLFKLNKAKEKQIKFGIIRKKYSKKLAQKFLIASTIIAKTVKLCEVLKEIFDQRKRTNLFVFLKFLNENDQELFIKQRVRKIRLKEFFRNCRNLTAQKSYEKKKLKKLKFKNCLKFFLNCILDKMLITQNKLKIKETLTNYIQLKTFLNLKINIYSRFKVKNFLKTRKEYQDKKRKLVYCRFFAIVKSNLKRRRIKTISRALFKRLLCKLFAKLQENYFLCSQEKIAKDLQMKNINKSFVRFKNQLKFNSKRRFLLLKEQAFRNKFEGVYNIKRFFARIKKKISANINNKESLRETIRELIKFDSQINFSAYNANFQKYMRFNSTCNLLYFRSFLKRVNSKIQIQKLILKFESFNCQKFFIKRIVNNTNKLKLRNQKLTTLKTSYKKYLFKDLLNILSDVKHERILISSFSQHINVSNINKNNESSLSVSKLNNSIFNYSDSFKLKIYNFLQQIRKSVKIKKSFEKFYQFKIITEGKIFVQKLKKDLETSHFKAYFENYFKIQNRLINYKFFLLRVQRAIFAKKEKERSKKRKVFDILKQNTENEKLIKNYLEEVSSIIN